MSLLERKYKAAAKTELDRDISELEQRGKLLEEDEFLRSTNRPDSPKTLEYILVDEQNAAERMRKFDEKMNKEFTYNPNDDYVNGEEVGVKLQMSAWKSKIEEEKCKRHSIQGSQPSKTQNVPKNESPGKKRL